MCQCDEEGHSRQNLGHRPHNDDPAIAPTWHKLRDRCAAQLPGRQREQAEYEIAMTEAGIERDLSLTKLGQDAQLTREQIAAKERLEALRIDNERQIFNAEAALRVNTGAGI